MTAKSFIVKPLPFTVLFGSAVDAGYDVVNVTNDYMGVVYKSIATSTYQYFDLDLGSDVSIDFVGLLGCTGAQAGWTIGIVAATEAQGASFSAVVLNDVAPNPFLAGSAPLPSGRGVGYWSGASVTTARYWRVIIGNTSAASVTIGRIVLGKRIIPAREFSFGAAFGVRDLGTFDFSPRGVPLWRRNKTKLRTLGISYGNAYKDEVEQVLLPLAGEIGNELPVFVCTDGTVDAQRQRRCYYGPLQGDLGAVWARANGFEFRVNMVSLI